MNLKQQVPLVLIVALLAVVGLGVLGQSLLDPGTNEVVAQTPRWQGSTEVGLPPCTAVTVERKGVKPIRVVIDLECYAEAYKEVE